MDLVVVIFCCLFLSSSVNGQGTGALRLVRNSLHSTTQAYTSGIVEIYYGGAWGNICDDRYFHYSEANVICHQLAFTGVSSYGYAGSTSVFGQDLNPMLLENIKCSSSSYLVLLQCSFTAWYSTYCSDHSHDVFVYCYTTKIWSSNPYSGQLRLVNGNYSNQGRLEVYCNGQWGTVCDDTFTGIDANVACQQLGYSGYSRYNYVSVSGLSSQPIWFDNVHCTSSYDKCLSSCQTCPSYEYHNCNHNEDVSLECQFSVSRLSGPYTKLSTCQIPTTSTRPTISTGTPSISTSTPSEATGGDEGRKIGEIIGGILSVLFISFFICCCVCVWICVFYQEDHDC